MRQIFSGLITVLVAISPYCQASAPKKPLDGCGKMASIANALEQLEKTSWERLSMERVLEVWPNQLEPFDCNEKDCRSLLHRGRIINNILQCGEKVDLDARPDSPAGIDKNLTVTVVFSDRAKDKVIAAAKLLAQAAGLPSDDLKNVGREIHQQFGVRKGPNEYLSSELSFTHNADIWTLSLHVDRTLVAAKSVPDKH